MASLKELQKAIDEKRVDTRSLNSEQLGALDQAFKTGELTGYDGIQDYERLISLGARSVASEKEKRLQGFEAATGITRGNFVLAGAAGMSMLPYLKDRDVLLDAFVKNGYKDIYGVDTRFASLGEIYKKRFTVLGDALKKLPQVRGPVGAPIRMLGNLAGMVDNTIDFFTKLGRYGASPALRATAGDIVLGGLGAGAGSAAYDIANLGTDFVSATSMDMANLTDNEIRKLPFGERMLFNALSETYNDMLWAGGALGLLSTVKYAGKEGMKNALGLNSEQSKAIAKSFEKLGVKPSVIHLIPGDNAFQNFFKKFYTTLGIYPIVSGPLARFNKQFNQNLTEEQFVKLSQNLDLAPYSNQAIMNYAGANQIRYEWAKVLESINTQYDKVRKTYDAVGNPAMIPTSIIKEQTKQLIENFKREYPLESFQLTKKQIELTGQEDPLIAFTTYLNSLPNYIRLSDWSGLSRMQTNAYSNTKFKSVKPTLINIRNAMERDLNSLNEATVRSNLKDKIFKQEYDAELAANGPQAAEAFLDRQIRAANQTFNTLKEANAYYSLVLRPFEKSRVAGQLRKMDSKLFADAGVEMTGKEAIYPDQLFDKVIRDVLASGSPAAIREIKQIIGLTKSKYDLVDEATGRITRTIDIPTSPEAKAMYDRYVRSWIWDAWNESTTNPLRDHRSLSDQAIAAQAAKQGLKRKRLFQLDDALEQKIRAQSRTNEMIDVSEVSPEIFTKSNIADISDGVIRDHDFGEVNLATFVKNLGLDKKGGREAFIEIFGGGKQGRAALERVEDILKVKSAIDGVDYSDPSRFVQRSLTLSAGTSGSIATGATAAAFGLGSTLKLILGSRLFGSQILLNPKLAEDLMELNKYQRFTAGEIKPGVAPKATRAFVRFVNSLMEAEGDDFRVDPNKVNFEEIRNKIQSLDPKIPLFNSYDFGTMPKFTRDRIYPEYDVAKKLTPDIARAGEEFLQGANLIGLTDEQFEAIGNSNPMLQATEPSDIAQAVQPTQPTEPQAMATPQMPQDTGQRAATYQALFPQDTLGQAVAARQFNKGGFVEDVYAQADEVLNA